jgi:medium-chain acyl-[acyl-carrier-protein] hydrolase
MAACHDGGVSSDAWWVVPVPRPAARLRLFCFPYAGGSATAYHRIAQRLPADIEAVSLQVPGRGFRLREPAVTSWTALLDAVMAAIGPRLDRPFALLGHSMGALVAFEIARRLRRGGHEAVRLFASAAPAPRVTRALRVSTALGSAEFWSAVHALYGTPTQVLADPELLGLVVPPLKVDFEMVAAYAYAAEAPLATPVVAMVGTEDPVVSRGDAEAWREETSAGFAMHEIAGRHLYLNEAAGQAAMLAIVRDVLASG